MTTGSVRAAPAARPALPLCGRAALWYAARGLRVHPLRPGGKLPLVAAWQERATTDAATITDWWARWPTAGVAIATGAGSGILVLDIDPRHGGDDALADLERQHGALPPTWRCLTAGGGVHLYLRHPGGTVSNRAGVWAGIDVRADGGYVVAAPTVLEGGGRYTWEVGHRPDQAPLADPPPWLVARLRAGADAVAEARPADEWAQLVRDGADRGRRNDTLARLAGYLLRRRPAPRVVVELVRAWSEARCRPPLEDSEIVQAVDSIARREAIRRGEA